MEKHVTRRLPFEPVIDKILGKETEPFLIPSQSHRVLTSEKYETL